jgi:hypothetical protein
MVECEPKTRAGHRPSFAVPDWLMAMLADQLAARWITGSEPDARVFVSPEGAPLHYSNWRRRVWLPAREAAGFPRLELPRSQENSWDRPHRRGCQRQDSSGPTRSLQPPRPPSRSTPKPLNGPTGMQPPAWANVSSRGMDAG